MMERLMRNLEYARYLIRHKWFVYVAGRATGAPLWRLLIHDWSKLLPSEWRPYRAYFYPVKGEEKQNHSPFQEAWNSHLHRNGHHWQYWVTNNDDGTYTALEIPDRYVREMVADWWGAGRAISGKWDAIEWFINNRENIKLHPKTDLLVVQILDESSKILQGVAAEWTTT
jgi:hypothetical protein